MHDVLVLALKGLLGGCLVVVFALLSESLSPKRFAGLFGAAPAVAIGGLTLTLLDEGAHAARLSATGMIAGGVGMIAYAAAAIPLLRRLTAARAAIGALAAWTTGAVVVAVPLLLLA